MRHIKRSIFLLIISLIVASCARKEKIIAEFKDGKFTIKEFNIIYNNLPPEKKKELSSFSELVKFARELAEKKLLLSYLKRTNIIPQSEISNLERKFIKNNLFDYYVNVKIQGINTDVDKDDVEKFLTGYYLRMLWLKTLPCMKEKIRKKNIELAEEIYKEVKRGKRFSDFINKYTDDPANFLNGEVKNVDFTLLPAEYQKILKALNPGEISEVFNTPVGYHILKMISFNRKGNQVSFYQIIVKTDEKKIKEAYRLLKAGVPFKLVANEYSEDEGNFRNGTLPYMQPPSPYYPVAIEAAEMEAGEVSKPIETPLGVFIVKVERKIAPKERQINQMLKNKKFLNWIKKIKFLYKKEEIKYEIKKEVAENYRIIWNENVFKWTYHYKPDEIVVQIPEIDLKISCSQCSNILNEVYGPTRKSDVINKKERIFNQFIFPVIFEKWAKKKEIDKEEEFQILKNYFLQNEIYTLLMNELLPEVKYTEKDLQEFYNNNKDRYNVVKVVKGESRMVQLSFQEARDIVIHHYKRFKKEEAVKNFIEKLKKKMNFKFYPERIELEKKDDVYYKILGDIYLNRKNYRQAEKYYKKSLKLNNKNMEVYLKLVSVYSKINRWRDIPALFENMIRKSFVNPEKLIKFYNQSRKRVKLYILDIMSKINHEKIKEFLFSEYQKSKDIDIKRACLTSLARVKYEKAYSYILKEYLTTKNIEIKQSCALALGIARYKKAFKYLFNDLKNFELKFGNLKEKDKKVLRWFIVEALGRIGDKRATQYLITMLKNTDENELKCFIIEALGRIKDKKAIPVLKECLNDRVYGVRLLASQALKDITGREYKIKKPEEIQ